MFGCCARAISVKKAQGLPIARDLIEVRPNLISNSAASYEYVANADADKVGEHPADLTQFRKLGVLLS